MTKFVGVFNGNDNSDEVAFIVHGDLTEDNVIDAIKESGIDINTSFYTNGVLHISTRRIDVEWENGDSLSAFNTAD